MYLKEGTLYAEEFGRGFAWLDTGTNDSMLDASRFVQLIEKRQGLKIACIEELSYQNEWITANDLKKLSSKYKNTPYGEYLRGLLT